MTIIFDGKALAQQKLDSLEIKIAKLKKKGINPKLVSLVVGNLAGNVFYTNLKKKVTKEIRAVMEVKMLSKDIKKEDLIEEIEKLNKDKSVQAIMIQLPLPDKFSAEDRDDMVNHIDPEKDVDGMGKNSKHVAPVVMAIETAMRIGEEYVKHNNYPYKIVVIGAKGFVGRKLMASLDKRNSSIYKTTGVDLGDNIEKETKYADFIVSVTGQDNLLKGDMVKKGAVVVDAGAPKGEVEFEDVGKKAAFITPVPGGVGPVTIACLMENLVSAIK